MTITQKRSHFSASFCYSTIITVVIAQCNVNARDSHEEQSVCQSLGSLGSMQVFASKDALAQLFQNAAGHDECTFDGCDVTLNLFLVENSFISINSHSL